MRPDKWQTIVPTTTAIREKIIEDEMPNIYLPGDVINLSMLIEHETNLFDVWANFTERPDSANPSLPRLTFGVHLKELHLQEWHGESRISEAILEREVTRSDPPHGIYDLVTVLGLPYGVPERHEKYVLAFDVPANIVLQISQPPAVSSPKITNLQLGVRRSS